MLAYDIADMLDRCGYPIGAASDHIRPALPAFLRAVIANAAADDSSWEDEAMHADGAAAGPVSTGSRPAVPDVPVPQRGRAPKMAYSPWFRAQGVELGAVTVGDWYWRCPVCRVWGGPERDDHAARGIGMEHRHVEHDRPAERRAEARKAARRVCPAMTAVRLDETVARLAAAHDLTPALVQSAFCRTAGAIHGLYGTYQDALFDTGISLGTARNGDYGLAPHPRTEALISAIAAELGRPGWLEERMDADASRRR